LTFLWGYVIISIDTNGIYKKEWFSERDKKMTSLEVTQEQKDQWTNEASELANIINSSKFAERIVAKSATYVVFLYDASTGEIIMSVSSIAEWNDMMHLFDVMYTPGDAELVAMFEKEEKGIYGDTFKY
jgi:hypothetical protein